jgi:hypothetical protein
MENQSVEVCKEKHRKIEADTIRIENNLDNCKEDVYDLKEIMAVMASTQERITKIVDDMQAKPGRRWEAVVSQVITIVIAASLGGLISRLF